MHYSTEFGAVKCLVAFTGAHSMEFGAGIDMKCLGTFTGALQHGVWCYEVFGCIYRCITARSLVL